MKIKNILVISALCTLCAVPAFSAPAAYYYPSKQHEVHAPAPKKPKPPRHVKNPPPPKPEPSRHAKKPPPKPEPPHPEQKPAAVKHR